jgi:hypothetical protein
MTGLVAAWFGLSALYQRYGRVAPTAATEVEK